MKRIDGLLAIGLMACLVSGEVLAAGKICVGLPGRIDQAGGDVVLKTVVELVKNAEAGTRIQVFDAHALQRICDIGVKKARGSRSRAIKAKAGLIALKRFLKKSTSLGGSGSVKDGEVRLPQFLGMISSTLRNTAGDTRVIVFGSPFYMDERDRIFTFGNGLYPSDGHILANPKQSIYGTIGKKDVLAGAAVDFCYLSESIFSSELERMAVSRFWGLYIRELGGTLTTFGPSADIVVDRVLTGVSNPATSGVLDKSVGIAMHRIVMNEETDVLKVMASSVVAIKTGAKNQAELMRAAEAMPKPKAGFLSIAAVWISKDSNADVDLWVRPHSKASELCFQNQETPEGQYLRDIQAAKSDLGDANWKAAWEVIEVRMAALENTTCWVNLYSGDGAKIEGVVRLLFDRRAVDVPFSFTGSGDKASGRGHRERSTFWIPIDVAKLWSNGSRPS